MEIDITNLSTIDGMNISIVIGTLCLLLFTKLPAPFIIIGGLIAGFVI
jgi:chromate transporter